MKPDKEIDAMNSAFAAIKDLDPEAQNRVLGWLAARLKITAASLSAIGQTGGAPPSPAIGGPLPAASAPTPKAFMAAKKPKTDVERVVCLAYYLTHYRGTPQFKTIDLTKLNNEAAQPPFSNAAHAVDNAARGHQYLTQAGKGGKQVTSRGEAAVEALPDREGVKAALEAHSLARRHRKSKRPAARGTK